MGGKKTVNGTYPRHLKGSKKGTGIVECQASGFLRKPSGMMNDIRQGRVRRGVADITPGFGTRHPQDVVALGDLDDPRPIAHAIPKDDQNYSKSELGYSDQEIEASIREGRAPRRGY